MKKKFKAHNRFAIERLEFIINFKRSIASILEIGSGSGYWIDDIERYWNDKQIVLFCVEINYHKLKTIVKRNNNLRIVPILADCTDTIPIKLDNIDLFIASYIGQYVEILHLFKESSRILKKNSNFLLLDWKKVFKRNNLQQLIINYDFKIVEKIFETDKTIGYYFEKK